VHEALKKEKGASTREAPSRNYMELLVSPVD
jgi:hypothetical protein